MGVLVNIYYRNRACIGRAIVKFTAGNDRPEIGYESGHFYAVPNFLKQGACSTWEKFLEIRKPYGTDKNWVKIHSKTLVWLYDLERRIKEGEDLLTQVGVHT